MTLKALYDITLTDAETGESQIIKAGDTVSKTDYGDKVDGWKKRRLLVEEGDEAALRVAQQTGAVEADLNREPLVDLRGEAEEAAAKAAEEAALKAAEEAARKVADEAKKADAAKTKAAAKKE